MINPVSRFCDVSTLLLRLTGENVEVETVFMLFVLVSSLSVLSAVPIEICVYGTVGIFVVL